MQLTITSVKKTLASLVKFAVVGTIGLIIDFSITWVLRDVLFINGYLASGLGFAVAASSNYYINSKWTFRTNSNAVARQFAQFFVISIIGLGLNILLLYFFQGFNISFYISKALAIGFVFIWNFAANSLITFRSTKAIMTDGSAGTLSIEPSIVSNILNANK